MFIQGATFIPDSRVVFGPSKNCGNVSPAPSYVATALYWGLKRKSIFFKWLHYILDCNLFWKRKKVPTIYLGSYDPFSDFDEKLNQEVGTLKQELGVTELGT